MIFKYTRSYNSSLSVALVGLLLLAPIKVKASAQTIWQKWNKGKTLLLPQLQYAGELEQKVADIEPHQPFKQQILNKIAEQVEQAPDLDTVDQLRVNLSEIASQINSYHQLQAQMEEVNTLWNKLNKVVPDDGKKWKPQIENWKQQFANLTADDELSNLTTKLKDAAEQLDEAIPRGRGTVFAKKLQALTDQSIIDEPPRSRSFDFQKSFQKANLKLKAFAWSSYTIALLLLIGAGFSELYVENETFGEQAFRDYFALLAWGFGAEASRDAISKAIEGWGLAGLDKN